MSQRSCRLQKAVTAPRSKGFPMVWAMKTAFVFPAAYASSRSSTRALPVEKSLSIKTGTAPFWTMGATVVGNPAAQVITSSPGCILRLLGILWLVKAEKAKRLADEPELTATECFTPSVEASSFSNAAPSGPSVSQKSSVVLTAAATSSSSKTLPAYGTTVFPATNGGEPAPTGLLAP